VPPPRPIISEGLLKDAVKYWEVALAASLRRRRCRPQKPKLDHLVEHDLWTKPNPRSAKLGAGAQTGSHGHGAHSAIDCLASAGRERYKVDISYRSKTHTHL